MPLTSNTRYVAAAHFLRGIICIARSPTVPSWPAQNSPEPMVKVSHLSQAFLISAQSVSGWLCMEWSHHLTPQAYFSGTPSLANGTVAEVEATMALAAGTRIGWSARASEGFATFFSWRVTEATLVPRDMAPRRRQGAQESTLRNLGHLSC